MPEISRFLGIIIAMFYNEHNRCARRTLPFRRHCEEAIADVAIQCHPLVDRYAHSPTLLDCRAPLAMTV
jgi:hypothetical protein